METILVTGGAGYVGAPVVHQLDQEGYEVVVFDNLSSGHKSHLPDVDFVRGDLRDPASVEVAFEQFDFDAVMHFAARSLVSESEEHPAQYYRNNVLGAMNLLDTMVDYDVRRMVFSSSAAVYGRPEDMPIPEDAPRNPVNAYGRTKLAVEHMLEDYRKAYRFGFLTLRLFNAAGAIPELDLGEDHDPETHLIPNLLEAMMDENRTFIIHGTDYPTRDGTCERDFVHVRDLASIHWRALDHLREGKGHFVNIGTGEGKTVREVAEKAMEVTGSGMRLREGPRRPGDSPQLVGKTDRMKSLFDWQPRYSDLETIIQSAWEWHQSRNRIT